jgi:hypothetical protein
MRGATTSLTKATPVRQPTLPLPEGLHLFVELRRFQELLDLRAAQPFSRPVRTVRQTPNEGRRNASGDTQLSENVVAEIPGSDRGPREGIQWSSESHY